MASVFRKGPSSTAGSNGIFATAKEEEPLVFAPLVELSDITAADMHEFWDVKPFISFPCIGAGCPACKLGNQAKYKSYMPILVAGETEGKILPMGIKIEQGIEGAREELGTITGKVLKLKRTGKGFATSYTVIPTAKTVKVDGIDIPNPEDHITSYDGPGMLKRLTEAGLLDAEETVAPSAAAKKTAPKPAAPKAGDDAASTSLWDEA